MTKNNFSLRSDKRPLHGQTADALNNFIHRGKYKMGDKLPGEIELAGLFGVSRPTLREALKNLESRGIIERQHGIGTFVAAPANDIIQGSLEELESVFSLAENSNLKAERADWVINLLAASGDVAKKLELQQDASVVRVQMTARNEQQFFAYLDSYILAGFIDINILVEHKDGSLLDFIIQQNKPRVSYTHTILTSVEANQEVANWLHIDEGLPLLFLEEIYYTNTGKPVVYERNYFVTDSINFRLVRRVKHHLKVKADESKEQDILIGADNRPLFNQVVDAINRFIEDEKYKPGDKLPREADLAQIFGISRATLREAIGYLENQGIVERRHGAGTFVTAPARGGIQGGLECVESLSYLAKHSGVDAKRVGWVIDTESSTPQIAEKLGLESGALVAHVQMTAIENNILFAFFDSYLPTQGVNLQDLKAFEKGSLLDYLLTQNNLNLAYTNTFLYSVAADAQCAGRLQIPFGKALFLLEETFFSEAGNPVMWTRNYFLSEQLKFHITRRIIRRL